MPDTAENGGDSMPFLNISSPLGTLRILSDTKALTGVCIMRNATLPDAPEYAAYKDPLLSRAAAELTEYFAGKRTVFDLPLAPAGTPFCQRVFAELRRVPFGTSVTYGELAARVGEPGAARAVGNAVGKNPLLIFIPCHRVLAKNGLGGFSSGIEAKKILLALENIEISSRT